jgi:hypothetical protein
MYISTTAQLPTATDSSWRANRYGSDVIEIDPSEDSKGCYGCTYYIAVIGLSESTYTLMVTMESTAPVLLDGVPQSGSVDMFGWNYYIFQNGYGINRDFKIRLTSESGNPDLYVTLGEKLVLTRYQYSVLISFLLL